MDFERVIDTFLHPDKMKVIFESFMLVEQYSALGGLSYFCQECSRRQWDAGSHYQDLTRFRSSPREMKVAMLQLLAKPEVQDSV